MKKSALITTVAFAVALAATFGQFGWQPFQFGW